MEPWRVGRGRDGELLITETYFDYFRFSALIDYLRQTIYREAILVRLNLRVYEIITFGHIIICLR